MNEEEQEQEENNMPWKIDEVTEEEIVAALREMGRSWTVGWTSYGWKVLWKDGVRWLKVFPTNKRHETEYPANGERVFCCLYSRVRMTTLSVRIIGE